MTPKELRQQFLDFFKEKGHKIVPSSSLIPTDPSVLFTTAGMQQFKPYYLGEESPYGSNVVSCQKCFRTSDIDQVGDESHLTFLEMLGNFSFGEYFKEEAIKLAYEFLFKELKLSQDNAIFTVFEGNPSKNSGQVVPEDKESVEIWKKLGIPENKIEKHGRKDNFWGPTGEEGPCGPTTEIHIKDVEVWNLVFNEYYQNRDKKLTPLKQKGVDTGMGLERLAMVVQGKPSVFETDLFLPIISEIKKMAKIKEIEEPSSFDRLYRPPIAVEVDKERAFQELKYSKNLRIISDHTKSAVFLISEGILPSNVERGYALRRILRRAIRYGKILTQSSGVLRAGFLIPLAQKVIEIYKDIYPELKSREEEILTVIQNEEEKFEKVIELGIIETTSQVSKTGQLTTDIAFKLYESYGMPLDISKEVAIEMGAKIPVNLDIEFKKAMEKHQEISRAGAEKKFGGGGEFSPKLHTATHLLHAALRKVLGEHVKQMGSDITLQRLRFDFSHNQKMTEEEIKKVEDLVNQKIKEDLEIKREEINYQDALNSGALALVKEDKSSFPPSFPLRGNSVFKEKYPEKVSVYSIEGFSKEICAGPHVKRTSELGNFKIIKEESSSSGIRRIRAILLK